MLARICLCTWELTIYHESIYEQPTHLLIMKSPLDFAFYRYFLVFFPVSLIACTSIGESKAKMTAQPDSVQSLAEQLEGFLEQPSLYVDSIDAAARHRLSQAARKVSFATEAIGDSVHRVVHSVS